MSRRFFLTVLGVLLAAAPALGVARDPKPVCRDPKPIPVVPAKVYNASHTCAVCGTYANVVKQEANGMHSHQCPRCGNEWWHADPPTAPLITLPASGCANGQCPAPSAPTRWRLFR